MEEASHEEGEIGFDSGDERIHDPDEDDHGEADLAVHRLSAIKEERDGDDNDEEDDDKAAIEETHSSSTGVTCTVLSLQASEVSSAHSVGHSTVMTMNDVDIRREQLYHQTVLLSIVTGITMGILVLTIVPLNILMALAAVAASSGLLSYVGFQRFLLEYQQIIAGDGLVQFLPASMAHNLTNMTLHEFMRDDTFFREWGFLAIYFVPGITEEQLNNYIRRLPRRQRNFLRRPGLGYFLGEPVMRALVGETRWRQQNIVGNTIQAASPETNTTRALPLLEEQAANGNDDPDNHESANATMTTTITGVVELPTAIATRSLIAPPTASTVATTATSTATTNRALLPPPEEEDDDASNSSDDDEFSIDFGELMGTAIQEVITTYARWAGSNAFLLTHDYLVEPALIATGSVGLGMSFLSMGVGMWQYTNRSSRTSGHQSSNFYLPAFWIGSGVLGGLSAGAMIYGRSAIRSFVMGQPAAAVPPPPPPPKPNKRTNPRPSTPKR